MADDLICKPHPVHNLRCRTKSGEAQEFYRNVVLMSAGEDCLMWPFAKVKGYGSIRIGGKSHLVSRLVCAEVNGPPPTDRHEAAHSCGNGHLGCVNPSHLAWKTPTQNQADKVTHGTHNRGERSGSAKLTPQDVHEIRSLAGRESYASIAKKYGISKGNVSHIVNRTSWR